MSESRLYQTMALRRRARFASYTVVTVAFAVHSLTCQQNFNLQGQLLQDEVEDQ